MSASGGCAGLPKEWTPGGRVRVEDDPQGSRDCSGREVVWASLPPDQAAALRALVTGKEVSLSSLIGSLIEFHVDDISI